MRLVAIGGSTGALDALRALVAPLTHDLDMAFVVVVHSSPSHKTRLPQLLSSVSSLPTQMAYDGQTIESGRMYIAPANMHLMVYDGRLRVIMGPRENSHRPSIDVLFRSAAHVAGPDAVGVIVSGSLDDGSAGLAMIKRHGGIAIVQDPEDARASDMPRNALSSTAVDYILPAAEIGPQLIELDAIKSDDAPGRSRWHIIPPDVNGMPSEEDFGQPSAFVCPECGGTLWELHGEIANHYRCRVGHAYSPETLVEDKTKVLEASLWTAVRSLQEQADFMKRVADTARRGHTPALVHNFEQKRRQALESRDAVRAVLQQLLDGNAKADQEREDAEEPELAEGLAD